MQMFVLGVSSFLGFFFDKFPSVHYLSEFQSNYTNTRIVLILENENSLQSGRLPSALFPSC